MMENRYIYHYCAVEENAQLAGIAQLTFPIKSQSDLNKLKELVTGDDFKPKSNYLSFIPRKRVR